MFNAAGSFTFELNNKKVDVHYKVDSGFEHGYGWHSWVDSFEVSSPVTGKKYGPGVQKLIARVRGKSIVESATEHFKAGQ